MAGKSVIYVIMSIAVSLQVPGTRWSSPTLVQALYVLASVTTNLPVTRNSSRYGTCLVQYQQVLLANYWKCLLNQNHPLFCLFYWYSYISDFVSNCRNPASTSSMIKDFPSALCSLCVSQVSFTTQYKARLIYLLNRKLLIGPGFYDYMVTVLKKYVP